ncbi:fimbrial subunit [Proteus penneri]|nr:fimbrial subunit [Proteus penneri]
MSFQPYFVRQMAGITLALVSICSVADGGKEIGKKHEGMTQIVGKVISTPCSIALKDRHQLVDFSALTLTNLSTAEQREQHLQPFEIELRDCGSVYNTIDSKTWTIRFDGKTTAHLPAFVLQGASQGVGVSVLDQSKHRIYPGRSYPLTHGTILDDKSGQSLVLQYFLQLELTGAPIQAGRYHGIVRFFIDYQ